MTPAGRAPARVDGSRHSGGRAGRGYDEWGAWGAAVAQYYEARGEQAEWPELEDLRATLSESVAGLAEKYPYVPVTLTLKHDFADEALSPRHGGWDMIVVGRHPMTSLGRLLTGSIATSVIERAHATVAVGLPAGRSRSEGLQAAGSTSGYCARHAACPVMVVRPNHDEHDDSAQ